MRPDKMNEGPKPPKEEPKLEAQEIDPELCPQCRAVKLSRSGACYRCPNCGYYSCSIE